ncbi:DUF397 domain-containing protein [Streptomyces cellulosae]|nr:DUF397 domain-containing protein [Streptomyces cellulosae]
MLAAAPTPCRGRPPASVIHIRDSKTTALHLTVTPAAWTAFLELAAGDFQ